MLVMAKRVLKLFMQAAALPVLLMIVLPLSGIVQHAQARDAMPALVFNMHNGEVLLAHDAGRRWHPASLTKLMTAWLVMDAVARGQLSFDDETVISAEVVRGVERGAAKYGVKPGDRMTIGRMLTFLMVRSDADMALALAEAVAGNVPAFVQRMNQAARRLGMTATRFTNPHGMHHPQQVSTARDMALLARAIYTRFLSRQPQWWRFFSLREVEKPVRLKNGKITLAKLKNRNHLLFMMPEANGMKTGFICASGFNLLATAYRDGVLLGAVVFGRRSAYNRASVARILLQEGFRRHQARQGLRIPVSRLRNEALPAPDLTHGICRTRVLPQVHAGMLEAGATGWSVVLGPFASPMRAVAATQGMLLAADMFDRAADTHGITRISEAALQRLGMHERWQQLRRGKRYRNGPAIGVVWNLPEQLATALCRHAVVQDIGCNAMAPEDSAMLAALLPPAPMTKGKVPKPRPRPATLIRQRAAASASIVPTTAAGR